MNREASREWTAALYRRFLPGEADAYATFLGLAQSGCPEGGTVVDLGCGDECYLACLSGKAAEIIGVSTFRYKLSAFWVSSFIGGVAGTMFAFCYYKAVTPEQFHLELSIQMLATVIGTLRIQPDPPRR